MVKSDQRKDGGMGSQHYIDEDACEEKPSGDFVTVILKKEKPSMGARSAYQYEPRTSYDTDG